MKKKTKSWRRWLYGFIAIVVIPVLFFLLLEIGLRIGGYGYPTAALVKYNWNGKRAYCDNYKFTWRFFPRVIAREADPFIFLGKKPADTYRIFVMGGSAAQGVPDGAFSFSRILWVMLREAYPGVNFEVINTAITAINSHVVLEIVKDCVRHEPDLFVVYMGNNEVVGPYGAGTVFGQVSSNLSLIRTGIYLNTTRLGQLLGNLVKSTGGGKKAPGEWRGLEMFLEKQVRAKDPGLAYVYNHFRRNLEDIRRIARKSGASIVFSTVGCNLKDNPPFASLHRQGMSEPGKQKWNRFYRQGETYESAGQYNEAVEQYLAAVDIDDHYAALQFRLGRCYRMLGEYEKAKERYIRARELDTLRFRADSRINRIIRQVVEKGSDSGVVLADAVKAFEVNSPHQAPGKEFFYEHVHMKFKGNYLLAKTIFQKIRGILPGWVTDRKSRDQLLLSEGECARLLAYTDWDRFNLVYRMLNNYIRKPPYSNQLYHKERVEEMEQKLGELAVFLAPGALEKSAAQYEAAVGHWPSDWWLYSKHAQLLFRDMKKYPEAAQQYRKVQEYLPHAYQGYAGLGFVLRLQGRLEEAIEEQLEAVRINPYKADVHNNLAVTYQMKGQVEKAEEYYNKALQLQPHFVAAYCNLGLLLGEQGRFAEAVVLCRRGLEVNPDSWALYHSLGVILHKQGEKEEAIKVLRKALKIDPEAVRSRELLNNILREKSKF
ncbi:MAG: tetratricopeptide repeat protein [Candidatus Aminicenantes bacterium]|nr:MAG: tetratricopeptide repeat protein [Candidatus Aminicenantes bacterium]